MQDLYYGISIEELMDEVDTFFDKDGSSPESRCIVGHGITFDRRFLHQEWNAAGKAFKADLWLDTKSMATRHFKDKGKAKQPMKLGQVCETLGLKKYASMHSAKIDTRATYNLFTYLMGEKVDYVDLIKSHPHNRKLENLEEMIDEIY